MNVAAAFDIETGNAQGQGTAGAALKLAGRPQGLLLSEGHAGTAAAGSFRSNLQQMVGAFEGRSGDDAAQTAPSSQPRATATSPAPASTNPGLKPDAAAVESNNNLIQASRFAPNAAQAEMLPAALLPSSSESSGFDSAKGTNGKSASVSTSPGHEKTRSTRQTALPAAAANAQVSLQAEIAVPVNAPLTPVLWTASAKAAHASEEPAGSRISADASFGASAVLQHSGITDHRQTGLVSEAPRGAAGATPEGRIPDPAAAGNSATNESSQLEQNDVHSSAEAGTGTPPVAAADTQQPLATTAPASGAGMPEPAAADLAAATASAATASPAPEIDAPNLTARTMSRSEATRAANAEQDMRGSQTVDTHLAHAVGQGGSSPLAEGTGAVAAVRNQGDGSDAGSAAAATATESGAGLHATAAETFSALDGSPRGPQTTWIHAGPHQAEAGFEDPSLGWISVRAGVNAGGIHAVVVPGTAEATQAIGANMGGLEHYLAEHHTPVESLTLAQGFGAGTGPEAGFDQGTQQQQQQQSARSDASAGAANHGTFDSSSVTGNGARAGAAEQSGSNPMLSHPGGTYISVMA